MFRNRRSSQKPNEDLIQQFQKTFADVVVPSATLTDTTTALHPQLSLEHVSPSKFAMDTDMKLGPSIPAPPPQDPQYMAPIIDPNTLQFIDPLSQVHGYYTPNSGVLGGVYHSPAGDLHTPGMGMNVMTPASLSQQAGDPPNGAGISLDPFHPQFNPSHFQNPQTFVAQATFAPSAFVQSDTGFDGVNESIDGGSLNDVDMQGSAQSHMTSAVRESDEQGFQPPGEKYEPNILPSPFLSFRQLIGGGFYSFRYHVTLRAPTAMINHQNEIPVTYLNKGQAYSMSVVDTEPLPLNSQPAKYRTYVRVSFQEEEQRLKPAACWQLWKEGRGTSEAHQRGGKLQAVEYVDPTQGNVEDQKNRRIQLESSSFDGFCVTWSPNPTTGTSDCAISVRFNFLSTDFSHSKGVKGIPVRLCAKTEIVAGDSSDSAAAEVCYCKVKLFRDHGAERKLSNDVAHVKKTIEKLRQQIQQNEMGTSSFGKRKRSSAAIAFKGSDPRPSKMFKHKRTLSMSSQDGSNMSVGDDLHEKLALLQDMFSSTRPVSILGLRGDEYDDPDSYPVQLPDNRDYIKQEIPGGRQSNIDRNALQECSPISSHMSINSPIHPSTVLQSNSFYESGYSRQSSEVPDNKNILRYPVKVHRVPSGSGSTPMGYIEAVDIDPTYRPPAERQPRPIACFYVRFPRNGQHQDDYYRAVYLTERTARDLMEKISMKQRIDPQRIMRILLVKENGLRIMVDDDVVRELPDGQDMVAEISEAPTVDNMVGPDADNPTPVEVKLRY
ncbi:grainyhead-like protein [Aspergillus lucknowensis]|uniref:CP2 transcription factor-domain-containing protein n=1 Tax=Aspergillus lucknowensis TaxID=176173 RepID=A0ABR4LS44_9EURO